MKDRYHPQNNPDRIQLSGVNMWNLPVGRLLEQTSRMGSDEETKTGLRNAKEALKEGGLIVLDAHHNWFDTYVTCINLIRELDVKRCVIPSSVKNVDHWYLKDFIGALNSIEGLDIISTFRDPENVEKDESEMYVDLTEEDRNKKNDIYINQAIKILQEPGSVALMAAYGGKNQLKDGKIRYGTRQILKTESLVLCTLSDWRKPLTRPETHVSENLLRFDAESTKTEMFEAITSEHRNIAERIKYYPGYFD